MMTRKLEQLFCNAPARSPLEFLHGQIDPLLLLPKPVREGVITTAIKFLVGHSRTENFYDNVKFSTKVLTRGDVNTCSRAAAAAIPGMESGKICRFYVTMVNYPQYTLLFRLPLPANLRLISGIPLALALRIVSFTAVAVE
ncbi:MAG: hypothetical protein V4628_12305 [Pseudomonadota bacterium]